jgi:hypothetical protein
MLKSFSKYKKALVIGIGGGADIVGTIPTKFFLESNGINCQLAGLPWERYSIDPFPGPRPFDQIINKVKINDSLCFAKKNTKTKDGLSFSESKLSGILKQRVVLINIFNSPNNIADDLYNYSIENKIDLIVGVDVGGDILAQGHEKGLASPLADSLMLTVLNKLNKKIETKIGVLGYGSDGELEQNELNESLGILGKNKGLIGSFGLNNDSYLLMKKIIKIVETDASRVPVLSFEGISGLYKIRRGRVEINIHPMSQITFYINTDILYRKISKSARLIRNANDIWDANRILLANKYRTELDFEIKKHLTSLDDKE